MKTKMTILAAALLVGIVSTTAVLGRDWVYPQATAQAAQPAPKDHCDMASMAGMNHMPGMCGMGNMSGAGGMCDMAAKPGDKGMACHSGSHGTAGASKEHKSCCN